MKVAWWRYLLSIIVFFVLFFLAPVLFEMGFLIANIITPKYFKSSPEWLLILSEILGVGVALECADAIVGSGNKKYLLVLSIICAIYCFFVGVWNFVVGVTNVYNMIAMFAGGIVAIVYAVLLIKK